MLLSATTAGGSQVLIHRLPTDAEFASDMRFAFAATFTFPCRDRVTTPKSSQPSDQLVGIRQSFLEGHQHRLYHQ
jgi:hypothetical protein